MTIDVCGLNDDLLVRGRAHAFTGLLRHLGDWAAADLEQRGRLARYLHDQPFADVLQAMLRQAHNADARLLFPSAVVEILRRPDARAALLC